MDYCDIVVYWGYGQMDPVWSLLLLLRPWMGHGYTVIQVVRLGKKLKILNLARKGTVEIVLRNLFT